MKSNKHTYYYICPYCGANLDPGEKCDCRERLQPATPGNEKIMLPKRELNRYTRQQASK